MYGGGSDTAVNMEINAGGMENRRIWSECMMKISNSKHQISNKSQIPMFNDPNRFEILNFVHCNLFVICNLLFGILMSPYTFVNLNGE
jgi:hypothetical protein